MKKIIAVVDAFQFKESQLNGYFQIAKNITGKVSIILLEQPAEVFSVAGITPTAFTYTSNLLEYSNKRQMEQRIRDGMGKLAKLCSIHHIDIAVHEASGLPLKEILKESRFADLLMIDRGTFLPALSDEMEPLLLADVLGDAQCPVLVLPENMAPVNEIIFTCNGSASSVYAIRQFTQLMDAYTYLPVQVVYVDEGRGNMPHKQQLEDYLHVFYDQVTFTQLKGDPAPVLAAFLAGREDVIVTFGAYGRSRISRFFHHSTAGDVLHTLDTPVFITHP